MNSLARNLLVWIAIIGAVLLFYKFLAKPPDSTDLMDSTRFAEALQAGRVTRVTLPRDATIAGELKEKGPDGKAATFIIATPENRELVDELLRRNVSVGFVSLRESSQVTTFLSWLPMLALIGIWIYFMRTMQAAQKKPGDPPGFPHAS